VLRIKSQVRSGASYNETHLSDNHFVIDKNEYNVHENHNIIRRIEHYIFDSK